MTANQVQIRRDSNTNLNAAVPADGELAYDTTNDRLRIGNGTTSGGLLLTMSKDSQNQTFLSADASGTNTITMTVAPVPAAYTKYQRFVFKAAATNTGATTINVNALGAKTVKKRTVGGVADLEGGEIIQDGVYAVVYDGTYMQLESDVSAAAGGAWELLATATASASATLDFTSVITSDYSSFVFVIENLLSSSGSAFLEIVTSTNNGSTYASTSYGYRRYDFAINNAIADALTGSNAQSQIQIGRNVNARRTGRITFYDPLNANSYTKLQYDMTYGAADGNEWDRGYGARLVQEAVNAVRFRPSSGNFTSGTIYLYGLKNS